jgi:hypothetical protein
LLRFQFDPNAGPNPGGGGNFGGFSPNDAQRLCKNTAGERLPQVPLAYISVYRGTDTGNGSYMINFRAQPPNGRVSSGFCIITRKGQMQNFQFDPPLPGGGNGPQDAMRSCKNAVSGRIPNVPLAYIQVNHPSMVGNGGYMVNFQAPNLSGFCNVYKNRPVEIWSGGRKLQ